MKQTDFLKRVKELGLTVFTKKDVGRLFPKEKYLNMTINRLARAQVIYRVTRGLYALAGEGLNTEKVATTIYYPSYISFEGALAKYGIINQGPAILTLATTKHSKRLRLGPIECEYRKIKPGLFFGFNLIKDTYLAEPEKAVLDTLYLAALGKRKVDSTEWDLSEINPQKLKKQAKVFGRATERSALALLNQHAIENPIPHHS